MKKKNLVLVGIILLTIVLAVLSVITALKIKQLGTQPIAPSVPQSEPEAADTIPEIPPSADSCRKSFTVALAPTSTPTPTGTLTPTPTSTPTPTGTLTPTPTPTETPTPTPTGTLTPTPTGTLTPTPTSTPKPTAVIAQAIPTEAELPTAGLKIPTVSGIITGFLLISIGIALVF